MVVWFLRAICGQKLQLKSVRIYFTAKMSKTGQESVGLSKKLNKAAKETAKSAGQKLQSQTESPYFSPLKTRNQRKFLQEGAQQNVIQKVQKKTVNTKKRPQKEPVTVTDTDDAGKDEKTQKWEPDRWKEIIENLKIMRKSVPAPVDTMGCDKCADEDADEKTQRFHKLVALMLSSQTKDQVTFETMNRLKAKELTPENVTKWDATILEDLIKPVSFYKNKAKHIQKTAQILIDQYDSDIPKTVEDLMKLPGVGPKMAHICMNTAWNIISGVGVDVHVHRICNRLKWVRKETKQPENTRVELESWLPSEHWSEVNALLVGFGQTICTAQNPKCRLCLNNQICPFASKLEW